MFREPAGVKVIPYNFVDFFFERGLRWLQIVFEIFSTRKRFTFIYIIAAFNVAT